MNINNSYDLYFVIKRIYIKDFFGKFLNGIFYNIYKKDLEFKFC